MTLTIRLAAGLVAAGIAGAVPLRSRCHAADDRTCPAPWSAMATANADTGNAQLTASPQDVPYPTLYPLFCSAADRSFTTDPATECADQTSVVNGSATPTRGQDRSGHAVGHAIAQRLDDLLHPRAGARPNLSLARGRFPHRLAS